MAKDSKTEATDHSVPGVKPEVVERVVDKAKGEGVPPETAKQIMREALEEGADPEDLQEVAEEAIEVEREDQEKAGR
jgi:(2Fe-2S) ferredoxin